MFTCSNISLCRCILVSHTALKTYVILKQVQNDNINNTFKHMFCGFLKKQFFLLVFFNFFSIFIKVSCF